MGTVEIERAIELPRLVTKVGNSRLYKFCFLWWGSRVSDQIEDCLEGGYHQIQAINKIVSLGWSTDSDADAPFQKYLDTLETSIM